MLAGAGTLVFAGVPYLSRRGFQLAALRDGGKSTTPGRGQLRARHALVAFQVATALVATYLPARRGSRLDPAEILKTE